MTEEWDFFRIDRLRDRLRQAVGEGVMSRQEAQETAAQAGCVLDPSESPDMHDPFELPIWSMPMALSWVAFRRVGPVRAAWAQFRATQYTWTPVVRAPLLPPKLAISGASRIPSPPLPPLPAIRGGETLERQSAPTLHDMMKFGSPYGDEFAYGSFKAVWGIDRSYRELVKSLLLGKVQATGADMRTGLDASPTTRIEPGEWSALQRMSIDGTDCWGFRPGMPVYTDVYVDRAALVDCFPEGETEQSGAALAGAEPLTDRSPKPVNPGEVKKFKADVVAAVIADPLSPPLGRGRKYWIAKGREKLTKRIAETAYVEALSEAQKARPDHGWSKQGRKKGSQGSGD